MDKIINDLYSIRFINGTNDFKRKLIGIRNDCVKLMISDKRDIISYSCRNIINLIDDHKNKATKTYDPIHHVKQVNFKMGVYMRDLDYIADQIIGILKIIRKYKINIKQTNLILEKNEKFKKIKFPLFDFEDIYLHKYTTTLMYKYVTYCELAKDVSERKMKVLNKASEKNKDYMNENDHENIRIEYVKEHYKKNLFKLL